MKKTEIRLAQKGDFEAISTLIASQNKSPETHCIHSDTGGDEKCILGELNRLAGDDEIRLVMSSVNGHVSGVLGCEFDLELKRGWLRGPFIVEPLTDWQAMATLLFEELLNTLPVAIHQLDTFLDIANNRGNSFYFNRGFEQLRLVHVYVCPPPRKPVLVEERCMLLHPRQAKKFVELHDSVFPGTYATGQRILDKLDYLHRVFVYGKDDEVTGYLYAIIDDDTGDGSVEYVGVHEEARGKGIGRLLLQNALQWLFEVKKVPQTMLVVNDNLGNARSLYESVGFRLKYSGVHNRKIWE